jgi:hypothetical protein
VHVRFLDDRRECPLSPPSRLQERGEVAAVPHPGHLQLYGPNPYVPGALSVAVALSHTPRATLVTRRSDVLFHLHLHERLGEYPDALLQEIGVVLYAGLAQQLRQTYPQLIAHRRVLLVG